MRECLLCEAELLQYITWQALIGLKREEVICENCSKKFHKADVINGNDIIECITPIYRYNEAMQAYLHQYKFLQDIALADVFRQPIREILQEHSNIIPIPMHPKRAQERTFSHVEQLLLRAGISYEPLLEKMDPTPMGKKTRIERMQITELFTVRQPSQIAGKSYILVDDIITTGTTLQHAAKVLKQAGAKNIKAVTLISAKQR